MTSVLEKIRHKAALIRAFFPSPLPQGMTEFKAYAESIIKLYEFPHEDGYVNMIATMIQHVPSHIDQVPKRHFKKLMRKAVANEVAFYVIQDLKLQQKKKQDAQQAGALPGTNPSELAIVEKPVQSPELS